MHNNVSDQIIVGNYFNKHESKNILFRYLVNGYRKKLQEKISNLHGKTVLEIGSGEGYILNYVQEVRPDLNLAGSDISHESIKSNLQIYPQIKWCVTKGEYLPFQKSEFDIVLACEVLEHLPDPARVLAEMRRVTKKFVVISVPQEPLWRILNMLRLKYVSDLGNTPGHLQHWSTKEIRKLVGAYFEVISLETTFPWTFLIGKKSS